MARETKATIIGGDFGNEPKTSSIVTKLAIALNHDKNLDFSCILNGGLLDQLNVDLSDSDFTIWMPNISNEEEKTYPKKKKGSFLICSKVMKPEYNLDVPVSRCFKMQANAVIAIDTNQKPFSFQLLDALANSWVKTTDIEILAKAISKLYEWSRGQIRIKSSLTTIFAPKFENQKFIDLVKLTADKIEASNVGRFFGNASTRCFKTFPSMRQDDIVYVSARNIDKARITCDDMVKTKISIDSKEILFEGKQPSVDTPVQLKLYEMYPEINYMIHGHAYIENTIPAYIVDTISTANYFPCGDLREIEEIKNLRKRYPRPTPLRWLNLKNHGFLILAEDLELLTLIVNDVTFVQRPLGETIKLEDKMSSNFAEPSITINGIKLSDGQAMTVRCALNSFAMHLTKPGYPLGNDEHGIFMTEAYKENIGAINRIICQ